MKLFRGSRSRFTKSASRPVQLRVEPLEDRTVPSTASAAFDPRTISVGFRTGDPTDPVVARAVSVRPGQTAEQAIAEWQQKPAVAYAELNYTLTTDVFSNDTYAGLLYGQ